MGLRRRKYPSGKETWVIDYRDPETGQKKLKTLGDMDKKTAELVWKEIQAKLAKAEFGIQSLAEQKKVKLSKLTSDFLAYSKGNLSEHTYIIDQQATRLLLDFFGDCYIAEITSTKLERCKQAAMPRLKKTTISMYFDRLRTMFYRAIEWDYATQNPFRKIKIIGYKDSNRVDFLSVEEIDTLLSYVNEKDWLFARYIEVCLYTGCRRNEVAYLEWADINYKRGVRGVIDIHSKPEHGHRVKFDRPRVIPINAKLKDVLGQIPKEDTFLFPGYQGHSTMLSWRFTQYIRRAEIGRRLTLHHLRHTFASHLAMQGTSLYIIAELLGHSSVKMTEIYAHLLPSELHSVVDRLPY